MERTFNEALFIILPNLTNFLKKIKQHFILVHWYTNEWIPKRNRIYFFIIYLFNV